ncbi:MAG TPA: N-6 DNA methylase [Gemmata sp.]|nr:N-6 DNA methylase [Gemmata sp.]
MKRQRKVDKTKLNGIQYTPPELGEFLADMMLNALQPKARSLSILDPACGDGGLLFAFAMAIPAKVRKQLTLTGYETDNAALTVATARLASLGVKQVTLHQKDFLAVKGVRRDCKPRAGFDSDSPEVEQFNAIIANPPYVRTQTLGSKQAQRLAEQFGLSGRVDLYHAFAAAMAMMLKPSGVLGLLTSNRFLTVKSGASLRTLLLNKFQIQGVYDLGDTKLFSAAVLPAIVIAKKDQPQSQKRANFDRVYECRANGGSPTSTATHSSLLAALRNRRITGIVHTEHLAYKIERGKLRTDNEGAWSLSTPATESWLRAIQSRQAHTFGDLAHVKVGIKTTADDVFIRSDWDKLPGKSQPESKLLRPLITHHEADKWKAVPSHQSQRVLYPHETKGGKRRSIDIHNYPRAAAYFESHRPRLENRHYVIDAGRKWYEIWVPHQPEDWSKPKIVWPDIAEEPRFFLDLTGAVVNGDCYWLTLKESVHPDWLLLMLAIANSTFAIRFYDTLFHNKLYSGRRRFMTQYVAKFPLPALDSPCAQQMVSIVSRLVKGESSLPQDETEINRLAEEAFRSGVTARSYPVSNPSHYSVANRSPEIYNPT